jgi:hypothetical protein
MTQKLFLMVLVPLLLVPPPLPSSFALRVPLPYQRARGGGAGQGGSDGAPARRGGGRSPWEASHAPFQRPHHPRSLGRDLPLRRARRAAGRPARRPFQRRRPLLRHPLGFRCGAARVRAHSSPFWAPGAARALRRRARCAPRGAPHAAGRGQWNLAGSRVLGLGTAMTKSVVLVASGKALPLALVVRPAPRSPRPLAKREYHLS